MPTSLPDAGKRVVDAPNFATVATVGPNGTPQLSVVWITREGDDLLYSTVRGRQKVRNLERDARTTVLIHPQDAPYSYLEVRGVAEVADDNGRGLIHELAKEYTGKDRFEGDPPDAQRVIVRVRPHKVIWRG
ncbi:MAG: PPOX class F420-dependent oxidoreductase [Micromonosporaceae bacterium]